MNLDTVPRATFEYLIGQRGVPEYLSMAAAGLTAAVGDYLAGTVTRPRLAKSYARALWWKRAHAVSHAVRWSYIAELKAAA